MRAFFLIPFSGVFFTIGVEINNPGGRRVWKCAEASDGM